MEKLYNNILLADDFAAHPSDAQNVPYLQQPPEIIDITVGRQLFVDDFLVEQTSLTPAYHKAAKYADNPVLKPEMPWETEQSSVACPKSGGVWFDREDGIFKMWYEGGWLHNMCYAESRDGVHWERPDLGIVKGTNRILPYDGYAPHRMFDGVDYLRPDSTTVWIDYDCPKDEKYKLFLRNPGGRSPSIVAVSGDGVHFERFALTSPLDDRSTMFYNPFRKKWVYSIRSNADIGRCRLYRECDNFFKGAEWTPDEARRWMTCDELDTPNPYIGWKPQLYNVDCVAYESVLLGMFQIMYGPENDVCERSGVPKITELEAMYSRDGYHFSRPCRESIIGASMHRGAWDRGYVQSTGGVLVVRDDELWIYYIGFAGDERRGGLDWTENGMYRNGATGIAKLRRDGFVSMDGSGSLLTRRITCQRPDALFVNADGRVCAEVLDAEGRVLARSQPFAGDSTSAPLRFDGFDLRTLHGKVFRLRFETEGALYAFWMREERV